MLSEETRQCVEMSQIENGTVTSEAMLGKAQFGGLGAIKGQSIDRLRHLGWVRNCRIGCVCQEIWK
jgi:hypothetical protein